MLRSIRFTTLLAVLLALTGCGDDNGGDGPAGPSEPSNASIGGSAVER